MLISPVCHSDGPGGAERYLTSLFARLVDHGHSVHLIGDVPGWALPATDVGFTPKWSRRSMLSSLAHLPRERRAVARVADGLRPGLFHAQFKREQIGLTKLLAARAPVIWTEHGTFPAGRLQRGLAEGYRRAARHVGVIICVSDAVAEQVAAIAGPHVRLEVVPNAVDTTAMHPATPTERADARAALGLPRDARVTAWVGRLTESKQPLLAAQAGMLSDEMMVMAGSGPLAAELAERADPSRIRLPGHLTDPSVVYRAADVFLFTSDGRSEGYPTYSLLEAAAHDLPIVTNAGSGLGPQLSGAALTVADDSPRALADAVASAVSAGKSRAWACQHDLAPWTARHAEIFASVGVLN